MTLEQLAVDHEYYCHTSNYYSNEAGGRWETWKDFIGEYGDSDMDYNLVFRWDVKKRDAENGGGYYMEVFIMGQRKGLFSPQVIESVTEDDVQSILDFMNPRYDYLKNLWAPLSNRQL